MVPTRSMALRVSPNCFSRRVNSGFSDASAVLRTLSISLVVASRPASSSFIWPSMALVSTEAAW